MYPCSCTLYFLPLYVTAYGKRDHSSHNKNAEKTLKIWAEVGLYGIRNKSTRGKYNHLPIVQWKRYPSATLAKGAIASLPQVLPVRPIARGHYAVISRGVKIRILQRVRVSISNSVLSKHSKMASGISENVVAAALTELSVSPGDQQGLSEFLTEYFGCTETEELGKLWIKLKNS